MAYIRLQSKQYEIDENSKSFEWGFGPTQYDAMLEELSFSNEMGKLTEEESDQFYELLDTKNKEEIEALWEEKGLHSMILPGVSCYDFEDEQDAAEELLEYFKERKPEALNEDEYYVLIFDGVDTNCLGHNGEDVVQWRHDIERVGIKEFFERYGLIVK